MAEDIQVNKIETEPYFPPQQEELIHPNVSISPYADSYSEAMKKYQSSFDIDFLVEKLKGHNIIIDECATEEQLEILDVKTTKYNEIIDVLIKVSRYTMTISIINILGNSPIHAKGCLDEGAFGMVYKYEPVDQMPRIIKCVHIPPGSSIEEQIVTVIIEYACLRIAAALGAAPSTQQSSFNIHVYRSKKQQNRQEKDDEQCIQFEMEYLERDKNFDKQDGQDLFKRLFQLHRIGLTHNDIKPSNILYSSLRSKWMLIDFGISNFPKEPILHQSQVVFKGTYPYCGQQMANLYPDQTGKVDLYWNDYVGLQKSLEKLQQLRSIKPKAPKLYSNDEDIHTHYNLLKLKYHLHYYNFYAAENIMNRIAWITSLKISLFTFLAELNYLPQQLKNYLRGFTWEDVSQIDFTHPEILFGDFHSSLGFDHIVQDLTILQQKKKYFSDVYNNLSTLKSKKENNQYLRKINMKKERKKIVEILCKPQAVYFIDKNIYYPLIFKFMNYLRSKDHLSTSRKIKICYSFQKYQFKVIHNINHSASEQADIENVFYFFRQTLKMTLNQQGHILRPSLIEIYINNLILGLVDSKAIQQMYECLSTLSDDPVQLCNKFYLVYCNNFWLERGLYNSKYINYYEIRKSILESMKSIVRKIATQKKEYKLCSIDGICLDSEGQMLHIICSNMKSDKRQFFRKVSNLIQISQTLKHNISMRVKRQQTNNKLSSPLGNKMLFRYMEWQIPLNVCEFFSEEMPYLNCQSQNEAYMHLSQIINIRQATKYWYPRLFLDYLTQDNKFHEQLLTLYSSRQTHQTNNAYYLQSLYQFRRYLIDHAQHFYDSLKKVEMLDGIFTVLGDALSEQYIAKQMVQRSVRETLGLWWYLQILQKTDEQKTSRILEIFKQKVSMEACLLKQRLKNLELLVYKNIFIQDEISENQDQIDTFVFKELNHEDADLMKLRYIEMNLVRMFKPGKYYMQRRFSVLCQKFDKFTKNRQNIYDIVIFRKLRTTVLCCYIMYLLKEYRSIEVINILELISENLFNLFSREANLLLLRLRSTFYNFYVLPQFINRWAIDRQYFLSRQSKSMVLTHIFLVYIQLLACRYYERNMKHSLSNKRLIATLYKSLLLHDKIQRKYSHQDIQLFYRCFNIMEWESKIQKNPRLLAYIGRKHKKLIERILSSENSQAQSQRLDQLKYYAQVYPIFIKQTKEIFLLNLGEQHHSLFKMKVAKMYRMQEEQNDIRVEYDQDQLDF